MLGVHDTHVDFQLGSRGKWLVNCGGCTVVSPVSGDDGTPGAGIPFVFGCLHVVVGDSCVVAWSPRRSLDGSEDASGGQACRGERLWWRFALSGHDQESIVIDAWTTGAERQQELIDGLLELFKVFRSSDGFVEARILKGSGGTTVLSNLRMRSASDERRLHEKPGIQAALETLRKIARPHRDLFDGLGLYPPVRRRAGLPLARGVLVRSAGE